MMEKSDEILELEALLEINESNLLLEWKKQPLLYINLARHAARASAAVAEMELEIKKREADLSRSFRSEGIPGIARPTDEAVKQAVRSDPEYQKLCAALIVLQEIESVKCALAKAAEMRERSLKYVSIMRAQPLAPEDEEYSRRVRKNALDAVLDGRL